MQPKVPHTWVGEQQTIVPSIGQQVVPSGQHLPLPNNSSPQLCWLLAQILLPQHEWLRSCRHVPLQRRVLGQQTLLVGVPLMHTSSVLQHPKPQSVAPQTPLQQGAQVTHWPVAESHCWHGPPHWPPTQVRRTVQEGEPQLVPSRRLTQAPVVRSQVRQGSSSPPQPRAAGRGLGQVPSLHTWQTAQPFWSETPLRGTSRHAPLAGSQTVSVQRAVAAGQTMAGPVRQMPVAQTPSGRQRSPASQGVPSARGIQKVGSRAGVQTRHGSRGVSGWNSPAAAQTPRMAQKPGAIAPPPQAPVVSSQTPSVRQLRLQGVPLGRDDHRVVKGPSSGVGITGGVADPGDGAEAGGHRSVTGEAEAVPAAAAGLAVGRAGGGVGAGRPLLGAPGRVADLAAVGRMPIARFVADPGDEAGVGVERVDAAHGWDAGGLPAGHSGGADHRRAGATPVGLADRAGGAGVVGGAGLPEADRVGRAGGVRPVAECVRLANAGRVAAEGARRFQGEGAGPGRLVADAILLAEQQRRWAEDRGAGLAAASPVAGLVPVARGAVVAGGPQRGIAPGVGGARRVAALAGIGRVAVAGA